MIAPQEPTMTTRSNGRSRLIKTRSKSGKNPNPSIIKKKGAKNKTAQQKAKNRSKVSVQVAQVEAAISPPSLKEKNAVLEVDLFSAADEDDANLPGGDEEMPLFQDDYLSEDDDDDSIIEVMPGLVIRSYDSDSDSDSDDDDEDVAPRVRSYKDREPVKVNLADDMKMPVVCTPKKDPLVDEVANEIDVPKLLLSIEKHQKENSSDLPTISKDATGNSVRYELTQAKQINNFIEHLSKCKFFILFVTTKNQM